MSFSVTKKQYKSRLCMKFSSTSNTSVEKYEIHGVNITGRYICQPKNWICLFLLMPKSKTLPQVLIISLGTSKLLIFSKQRFLKIYFPPAEREEDYRAEKRPKLNLRGNWSQSSINSSIFQPLHFCFLFCCSII